MATERLLIGIGVCMQTNALTGLPIHQAVRVYRFTVTIYLEVKELNVVDFYAYQQRSFALLPIDTLSKNRN